MKPPVPDNEAARLEALRRYRILDTAPERHFDDITKLAASICGVPMASISLVDEDRQWFKSRVGMEISETTRKVAFCSHAILGNDLLVIPDALADERFIGNPLVKEEPCIRFYAGAPLLTAEGHALGTLCVFDRQPRQLVDGQGEALKTLARVVVSELELRRVSSDLAEVAANFKTLSGLLPICAYCKGIRNDQGYWQKVEAYIEDHSQAEFTHGICPQCARKNFPEIDWDGQGL